MRLLSPWLPVVFCLCLSSQAALAATVTEDIAALERVLSLPTPDAVQSALQQHEQSLLMPGFVQAWYQQRDGQPLWTEATQILTLRAALHSSRADGLLDNEFRRPAADDPFNPDADLSAAERDILLTDTLVALGDRLANGRADPRGLAVPEGAPRTWVDFDPAELAGLSAKLDGGELVGVIDGMRPDSTLYRQLRQALGVVLDGHGDILDVDTLRVNLERARWFDRLLGESDRLVVNIPAYSMNVYLDGQSVLQSRVIVGKPDRRTPVFVSELQNVVLDPTWTVPRSIIKDSLFDEARADPAAFEARGFQLRDVKGVWHAPTGIDWQNNEAGQFPYDMVQMPGGQNALGRVKFMFDNPYSVYLHDTPSPGLFESEARAFSHGCIRVQDPDALARLLLGRRGGLDEQAIASLYADTDNLSVDLLEPLAIGLLYWTVDVDQNGQLVHYEDIYQRDAAILHAIDQPDSPPPLERPAGS